MATAVCDSANRAPPDQFRGCAEIRRVVGQSPLVPTKAISKPDEPSQDHALEEADQPGRSGLMLTRIGQLPDARKRSAASPGPSVIYHSPGTDGTNRHASAVDRF